MVFVTSCRNWVKEVVVLPDIGKEFGKKPRLRTASFNTINAIVLRLEQKNEVSHRKRGYRAEVRRERKKRDIPSPVNVLHTK
jgi:hypothetical protein